MNIEGAFGDDDRVLGRGSAPRGHQAFKEWQRRNGLGYVMNFPDGAVPIFHKSGCSHIRDFSDPKVSLTRHRKICSTDRAELVAFVGKPSVNFDLCADCSKKSHAQL